jgi:site-specific recombinase XerD
MRGGDRTSVQDYLLDVNCSKGMILIVSHGTGYYLANRGIDTRTIQSYLGH